MCLIVLFALGMTASAQTGPRDVDLRASDGILLKATYYPAAKPGPGIMLLHQCNRDRKSWTELAGKLSGEGFNVLTLDYRGYGESGGDRFLDLPPERQVTEQAKWKGDIDLAYAYLIGQLGVDKIRIGAGGASCGVNQSIQLALRHPEVKSLALLSGTTDEPGRRYLRKTTWLPLFVAASDDDGGVVTVMRWLLDFSLNPRNRFVEYKAAGHGTEMFRVEQGLQPLLEEWFDKTLRNAPANPTAASVTPVKASPSLLFWETLTAPNGVAKARQMYADAKKRDPNVSLFPEFAVNLLGYERLQAAAAQEAVEIFKLNAEAYPDSANVYDSLADGYVAAGNKDLAITASEKALELLRTNPPKDGPTVDAIRQASEERIKKLRGGM
jgi:pimeloyl-ACP methyl ester carboxylesterase